jgi:predicted nuclease of predicted toxin-antitoxin system
MHFLIDASLPRSTADLIRRAGHLATDVRDIGLGTAADTKIAAHALANRHVLITADFDFADIRVYAPQEYHGIVVIDRPENAPVAEVLELVNAIMREANVLAALPGRLAIVGRHRIRLRPAADFGTG